MSKSMKDLKKENTFLKSKCDKTDVTLIEFANEVRFAHTYIKQELPVVGYIQFSFLKMILIFSFSGSKNR